MKKLAVFMISAVLPAAAQWRHFSDPEFRPTGFFGVGVSAPVNPIATRLKTGWNLAGGVGVQSGYAGILLDAMYNDFGMSRNALLRADARHGHERYWALTVDPIVHVNPRGPVDFYLTGGAGVYGRTSNLRTTFTGDGHGTYDLISSYSIARLGANLGAGFAFNLGGER